LRVDKPAAHIDLNILSDRRILPWDIREPDIPFQERRRTAGSDSSHSLSIDNNFLFVTGDPTFCYFKSHQSPAHTSFFLPGQSLATDKLTLVQFTYPAEIGLQQRRCFVNLVFVKRHACLEP
jgi:hypothetical protein